MSIESLMLDLGMDVDRTPKEQIQEVRGKMNLKLMYYIALGTVADLIQANDAWAEFAATADGEEERCHAIRKSLKAKARYVVGFDREMDRLVKEYN